MKAIFAALIAFCIFSCSKSSDERSITVDVNTCTDVSMGKGLKVCFDTLLEDSRCPANTICVWQGAARAQFRVFTGQQIHTIWLSTIDMGPHYKTDTTLAGYHLKLVNILPYPGTAPGNPVAVLKVSP